MGFAGKLQTNRNAQDDTTAMSVTAQTENGPSCSFLEAVIKYGMDKVEKKNIEANTVSITPHDLSFKPCTSMCFVKLHCPLHIKVIYNLQSPYFITHHQIPLNNSTSTSPAISSNKKYVSRPLFEKQVEPNKGLI